MSFLALPFPDIDPIAFSLGPLSVRWYGLAYMAGLLLGWLYVRRLLDQERLWSGTSPLLPDQADSLLLWMTLGVVIGGRLGFFLLYEPRTLIEHPELLPQTWHGGMAFHGGLLGSAAAMALFAWRQRVSLLSVADVVAAATPIGLFFGRLANFINAEVYGRVTGVPWGVVFPSAGPEPRHPSQLYEAALEGLLLFLILRALTHGFTALRRPGLVCGAFLLLYGAARIFCELFREPDPTQYFDRVGVLTSGMVYSLPLVAVGLVLILMASRRQATA